MKDKLIFVTVFLLLQSQRDQYLKSLLKLLLPMVLEKVCLVE